MCIETLYSYLQSFTTLLRIESYGRDIRIEQDLADRGRNCHRDIAVCICHSVTDNLRAQAVSLCAKRVSKLCLQ